MRKTPEDFYELYTMKFRPLFLKGFLQLDNNKVDLRFEVFAWFAFMHCVLNVYSTFEVAAELETPTIEGMLKTCSTSQSRRLFKQTCETFDVTLRAFLSPWVREMLSLRYDVDDSELVEFVKTLKEMK